MKVCQAVKTDLKTEHRAVGTQSYGKTELWEHRAVCMELWEHRAVGTQSCGNTDLWEHRAVGTQTYGRAVGTWSCGNKELWEHRVVRT